MNTNFNNKFVNLSKNLFEKFTEDGEYIFGSAGVFNPDTGDYTETDNVIKISCRKNIRKILPEYLKLHNCLQSVH